MMPMFQPPQLLRYEVDVLFTDGWDRRQLCLFAAVEGWVVPERDRILWFCERCFGPGELSHVTGNHYRFGPQTVRTREQCAVRPDGSVKWVAEAEVERLEGAALTRREMREAARFS